MERETEGGVMKRVIALALLVVLVIAGIVYAVGEGRPHQMATRFVLTQNPNEIQDAGLLIPPRSNSPALPCVTLLQGIVYWDTGSQFYCVCRDDGTPAWEQLHTPGQEAGCG